MNTGNYFPYDNEATEIFGINMTAENDPAKQIFEDAGEAGALDDFARKQIRSQAMACALSWVAEGDYSYQALDDVVTGIADLDGDDELSDDEEAYYNELLTEMAYALTSLGADVENVKNFIDNEDDDEGAKLGEFLSGKMDQVGDDDETIIGSYAISNAPIMESTVKVIRDGKIVLKKKRIGRPRKMSAAQKAALKIARRKANTGAAKLARKKSMKLRKKRGL